MPHDHATRHASPCHTTMPRVMPHHATRPCHASCHIRHATSCHTTMPRVMPHHATRPCHASCHTIMSRVMSRAMSRHAMSCHIPRGDTFARRARASERRGRLSDKCATACACACVCVRVSVCARVLTCCGYPRGYHVEVLRLSPPRVCSLLLECGEQTRPSHPLPTRTHPIQAA